MLHQTQRFKRYITLGNSNIKATLFVFIALQFVYNISLLRRGWQLFCSGIEPLKIYKEIEMNTDKMVDSYQIDVSSWLWSFCMGKYLNGKRFFSSFTVTFSPHDHNWVSRDVNIWLEPAMFMLKYLKGGVGGVEAFQTLFSLFLM